jgi:hypothetical protein
MDYEKMDWETEAKRVEQAFGIVKSCVWEQELLALLNEDAHTGDELETTTEMRLELADSKYDHMDIGKSHFFECVYSQEGRTFQVYDKEVEKSSPFYNLIEIAIAWDGNYKVSMMTGEIFNSWNGTHGVSLLSRELRVTLARGLFFLRLLTPAIETSLEVTISAHEELEWALEYETRNGL